MGEVRGELVEGGDRGGEAHGVLIEGDLANIVKGESLKDVLEVEGFVGFAGTG